MKIKRPPRNIAAIAILFLTLSAIYALAAVPLGYHIEWAGVTMLGALAIALSILAYVLIAGSPRD
jgi:hypothetical protein